MENRVLFGLIMLGEDLLAVYYLVFCWIAFLGVLQFVAARQGLRGMQLLPQYPNPWLGLGLAACSYLWFYAVRTDLNIPGLAGGELSTFALVGFALALVTSLGVGFVWLRLVYGARASAPARREQIKLDDSSRAELWMPEHEVRLILLALRESSSDALPVLAAQLVSRGAAVLLCDAAAGKPAMDFIRARFKSTPLPYAAVGAGAGADRVLARDVAQDAKIQKILALAPYGTPENRRAGVRWLCETDYLTAYRCTRHGAPVSDAAPEHALVVFGDDDTLVPPAVARRIFPRALMVAGGRHFDLAAQPATLALAVDWLELPGRREAERASVSSAAEAIQSMNTGV